MWENYSNSSDLLDDLKDLLEVNVHPHDEKGNPESPTEGHIDQDVLLHLGPPNDDLDLPISQNSFIV